VDKVLSTRVLEPETTGARNGVARPPTSTTEKLNFT